MAVPGVFPKVSGDEITAADYNAIQTLASGVRTGFLGVDSSSVQVAVGSTVTASHWNNLKTDIDYCISYLGLSVTTISTKSAGTLITAADVNLYYTNALFAFDNRTWFINLVIGADTRNYSLSSGLTTNGTYTGSRIGKSTITLTVNSGIYVGSTSAATPSLTVGGTAAGDTVSLVNNGTIIGAGGAGGKGADQGGAAVAGSAGGTAISAGVSFTVTNNGVVAGGGGGGGGGDDSNGACFLAGTMISTPNGLIPIEDIKEGDVVYGYDATDYNYSSIIVPSVVSKKLVHTWEETRGSCPLLVIKHEHGVLNVTVNHEILTSSKQNPLSDKGFARADELEVGDTIYTTNGVAVKIQDITKGTPYELVYNFEVEDVHTYIADGIRVHNGGGGKVTQYFGGSGGGGGAGYNPGAGGAIGTGSSGNGSVGSAGTRTAGGAGGTVNVDGGAGGGPGSAGGTGGSGGGVGGAAGNYLTRNTNTVTWTGTAGVGGLGA